MEQVNSRFTPELKLTRHVVTKYKLFVSLQRKRLVTGLRCDLASATDMDERHISLKCADTTATTKSNAIIIVASHLRAAAL